jgi:AraC family transcriptional regulator of adaptative response/methylated-DNA-[protein]-cysteine methyltransferase
MIALDCEAATEKRFATDEERWHAVQMRDKRADNVFVYSVKTTGVYCRPSCAAKCPKRENVRFYGTPKEAEQAGFRACKRCGPNAGSIVEQHAAAVSKACKLMEGADESPNLETLAAAAGMSASHFHRTFKSLMGVTPKQYASGHRSQRVREGLLESATVTGAIYDAGFNSNGRFYETSKQILGMTPTAFRGGGKGAAANSQSVNASSARFW